MNESLTLAKEGESDRKHGEKRVDFTMHEGRIQGGEGGQEEPP